MTKFKKQIWIWVWGKMLVTQAHKEALRYVTAVKALTSLQHRETAALTPLQHCETTAKALTALQHHETAAKALTTLGQ